MDLGIDGLEWQRKLGAGGFATVHAARDEVHGRDVAVKILHTHADDDTRRRFDRERRTMGSLSAHPNIASIFTSGYTRDERPYLVMELVSGGSLADRMAHGPMPWHQVEPILSQLLDAVETGHRAGVIHRDIKPANVLVTTDGRPLLTDFGIATVAGDLDAQQTISATPAFASPELLQGQGFDERTDLYSLAATAFALLTGGQPYGTTTDGVMTVLGQIASAPVPRLDRSDVPARAADALVAAMAKAPSDRPASAEEFRRRLAVPGSSGAAVAASVDDPNLTRAVGPSPSPSPVAASPSPATPPSTQPPPTSPSAPPPSTFPAGGSTAGTSAAGGSSRSLLVAAIAAAALAVVAIGALVVLRDDGEGAQSTDISSETTVPGDDGSVTGDPDATAPTTEPEGAGAPAEPLTIEDLAQRVVQVQLLLDGEVVCTGSGTIVSADGLVLTNRHVVAQTGTCPHDTIGVAVVDRSDTPPELRYEADLLVDDAELDLAVIRIARALDGAALPSFDPVPIGSGDTVALGDELRILGFPAIGGETITVTSGNVSGFVATPEGGARSWIKTDAALAAGNSGGLAADAAGTIVGIPTQVGAGSGDFVDCRVIADSNGDGVLDDADTCVPTGGFINGIRPVEFALGLIDGAATATPQPIVPAEPGAVDAAARPFVYQADWSLAVDDQGAPVDEIVSGSIATTQVCLTWTYENVRPGAAFDLVWSIDGVTNDGDVVSGTNQGESAGDFFGCYGNGQNPINPGRLEARWDIDGEAVFSEAIYVGPDREVIGLVIVNQGDEQLCNVSAIPAGATSFGTNDLDQPVEPGATVTIDVARGAHDVVAVDCLGQVVFESRGLAVDEALGPVAVPAG